MNLYILTYFNNGKYIIKGIYTNRKKALNERDEIDHLYPTRLDKISPNANIDLHVNTLDFMITSHHKMNRYE